MNVALSFIMSGVAAEKERPKNVIFIICDDLDDSLEGLGGHPQAYTPNLNRLASMGVRFTNAHSNCPMCAPSRPSLLSGLYPHRTGKFHSAHPFRTLPLLENAVLFPTYFTEHGYHSYSGGKVFHGTDIDNREFGASGPKEYDGGFLGPLHGFSPYPWDGKTIQWNRPSRLTPNPHLEWMGEDAGWEFGFGRLSNLPADHHWAYCEPGFKGEDGKNGGLFKYNGPEDRSLMPDELVANWAVDLISGNDTFAYSPTLKETPTRPLNKNQPFMLALGFTKTHSAFYSPDEFFDAVLQANNMTEDDVILPWTRDGEIKFGDLDDIPPDLRADDLPGRERYRTLERAAINYPGGMERFLKGVTLAYLAAVNEIDAQVGKILDALEASGQIDQTLIIFTSDHGYNLGDKEAFFKYLLWEKSTRVPFIVYDPSSEFDASRGKECSVPISLIDLYPSLLDLCGLPAKEGLDGFSIRPLLKDPENGTWDGPSAALSVVRGIRQSSAVEDQSYSLRSERYRYSLGRLGGEELYDHQNDRWEWTNLADHPEYATIKAELKKELLRLTGR